MQASAISRLNPLRIIPRRVKFHIDSKTPRHWHSNSACITHFFTAFSMSFPNGEKFFIESVKAFEKDITDQALLEKVEGFVRQEAQHSIHHRLYNESLLNAEERDLSDKRDRKYLKFKSALEHHFTDLDRLALTVAYEHITAVFADKILRYNKLTEGMLDSVRPLWIWHCIEETEHKSVAFDVYKAVGGRYRRRIFWFMYAMLFFPVVLTASQVEMLWHDRNLFDLRDWFRYAGYMFGRQGLAISMVPDFARYIVPGFHPWQIDNHTLIEKWRAEVDSYVVVRELIEA